jgi:hypothetical protein
MLAGELPVIAPVILPLATQNSPSTLPRILVNQLVRLLIRRPMKNLSNMKKKNEKTCTFEDNDENIEILECFNIRQNDF